MADEKESPPGPAGASKSPSFSPSQPGDNTTEANAISRGSLVSDSRKNSGFSTTSSNLLPNHPSFSYFQQNPDAGRPSVESVDMGSPADIINTITNEATYFNGVNRRASNMGIAVQFQETSSRVGTLRKPKQVVKVEKLDKFTAREVQMDEHTIPLSEVEGRLSTSAQSGISPEEAKKRLEHDGPNCLTPPKATPKWIIFLREMTNPFALILWAAGVMCFIAFGVETSQGIQEAYQNAIVGVALFLIVFITGVFSYVQTVKSADTMASFAAMAPKSCTVIRSGEKLTIDAKELVVGDLVEVGSGDRIPADILIVESFQLKVDNSSLTGESDPQARTTKCTSDNPLETANLAFCSTSAVDGTGKGIVVQVGDETVIGQLAGLVSSRQAEEPLMLQEIKRFVKWVTVFAVLLATIFLIYGLVRKDKITTLLVLIISIVVAIVPEGLPASVAVALALAAKRMSRKNVLVTEQLAVVETLGRTTVIASDKTGTLTQNRMTVSNLWFDMQITPAEELLASVKEGSKVLDTPPGSFSILYQVGALCSRSEFEAGQENVPILEREVVGDASETAILKFCESVKTVLEIRSANPKILEIPFNSANKFQVSIHALPDRSHPSADYVLVMKGAPERILARCSTITINGKVSPLSANERAAYDQAYDQLGRMGERVLGFCMSYLSRDVYPKGFVFEAEPANFPLEGLCFAGLMSMIDPPRPSVPDAIRQCHQAGIKVAMVTGDHPVTAEAIAKKIGLLTERGMAEKRSVVIHGDQLREMTDPELDSALAHDEIVFARTSPQQKLRIVEGFQRLGHIVAVTGDGVNDSPALKQANVGVAMGISGTDVSKDASDIILLDDNFGSIVNGIAEGRVIFDNMKKSIAYTLSSKFPEIVPYVMSFFFLLPQPLNTLLMLSIDVATDLLPAISLAYEKAESSVMKRKPCGDSPKDKLVTIYSLLYSYPFLGMIQTIAGFLNYFAVMASGGGVQAGGGWGFYSLWQAAGRNFVDPNVLTMTDSNGIKWRFAQRHQLHRMAITAYFVAVLVVRVGVLLTCTTVEFSLFKHNFRKNKTLLIGACEVIVVAVIIAYTPGIQFVFGTAAIPWWCWFVPMPFVAVMISLDEIRKLGIRMNRGNPLGEALRY